MKPAIIFVCSKLLSFNNFRRDLGFSKSEELDRIKGWSAFANWKPKSVKVGKWNIAGFPPKQFCEKLRVGVN